MFPHIYKVKIFRLLIHVMLSSSIFSILCPNYIIDTVGMEVYEFLAQLSVMVSMIRGAT